MSDTLEILNKEKAFLCITIGELMDVIKDLNEQVYSSSDVILKADKALKFLEGEMNEEEHREFIDLVNE
jgi:hypothetical protein